MKIRRSLSITLVEHMDEVLEHAIILKEGETVFKVPAKMGDLASNSASRITSYNVCYTKLLRQTETESNQSPYICLKEKRCSAAYEIRIREN